MQRLCVGSCACVLLCAVAPTCRRSRTVRMRMRRARNRIECADGDTRGWMRGETSLGTEARKGSCGGAATRARVACLCAALFARGRADARGGGGGGGRNLSQRARIGVCRPPRGIFGAGRLASARMQLQMQAEYAHRPLWLPCGRPAPSRPERKRLLAKKSLRIRLNS